MHDHVELRKGLIIASSGMIDIVLIMIAVRWVIYANNFRIIIVFFMFYAMRAFLQSIFFMTFPEGFIWDYPGFPSVAVEYFYKNDFFYSGHLGMLMISFLEFRRDNLTFMSCFAMFALLFNFFMLVATRSHYSIDLIAGIIIGHYCFIMGERISDFIDGKKKENPKYFEEDEEELEDKLPSELPSELSELPREELSDPSELAAELYCAICVAT